MRFFRRASVSGWLHTASKSPARASNSSLAAGQICRTRMACSIRASTCWTFCRASFHRHSNSLATKRLSGSVVYVLFLSATRVILGGLQLSLQRGLDFALLQVLLFARQHGCFYRCRLNYSHEFATYGFIQTQTPKRDAGRFPVVQRTSMAYIPEYKRCVARVVHH